MAEPEPNNSESHWKLLLEISATIKTVDMSSKGLREAVDMQQEEHRKITQLTKALVQVTQNLEVVAKDVADALDYNRERAVSAPEAFENVRQNVEKLFVDESGATKRFLGKVRPYMEKGSACLERMVEIVNDPKKEVAKRQKDNAGQRDKSEHSVEPSMGSTLAQLKEAQEMETFQSDAAAALNDRLEAMVSFNKAILGHLVDFAHFTAIMKDEVMRARDLLGESDWDEIVACFNRLEAEYAAGQRPNQANR